MGRVRERRFRGKAIRVSVRWNPGIGRGFNPKVVTAGARTSDGTPIKFGVEESKVVGVFERAAASGSSRSDSTSTSARAGSGRISRPSARPWTGWSRKAGGARRTAGSDLEFLDFGGGFGPRYAEEPGLFPVERYLRHISRARRGAGLGVEGHRRRAGEIPGRRRRGAPPPRRIRQGELRQPLRLRQRRNVQHRAPAGHLSPGRTMRSSTPRGRRCREAASRLTVAGNLCETGDVFGKERLMPRARRRGHPGRARAPGPTAGAWPRTSTCGTSPARSLSENLSKGQSSVRTPVRPLGFSRKSQELRCNAVPSIWFTARERSKTRP